MQFIDTDILLYAISQDPDEQDKAKSANEILVGVPLTPAIRHTTATYSSAAQGTAR